MILTIAEKPSVSQTIANAMGARTKHKGYIEGNNMIFSWCYGHLAEYYTPDDYDEKYKTWRFIDLPIIPDQWKLKINSDRQDQFDILKKLLNRADLDYVVNACDAGREGELIFNQVYQLSGSSTPIKRLWINSMEDNAIQDGFRNMKDGSEYQNLYDSSVCRTKADWIIGINATRAYTSKYRYRLSVGRVQTPTLAMLVERQEKINNFTKEPYYRVTLTGDGLTVKSAQIDDKNEAEDLARRCNGKTAVINKFEKTKHKNMPPKLYDLTTLQRDANRLFGYTAQETLDAVQTMYESKLVTYPRTDSQYITDDMTDTVIQLLATLPTVLSFLKDVDYGDNVLQIVNNSKVSDHTALLPTERSTKSDLSNLSEREYNIFSMIVVRLMEAVSEPCLYESVKLTAECDGTDFTASEKKIISQGWRVIEETFRNALKVKEEKDPDPDTDDAGTIPSNIASGSKLEDVVSDCKQHFTSPPKPYTEDTLLSSMERAGNKEFDKDTEKKGLGTPATRAGIIEKLVSSNYAARKGKTIIPTEDGIDLISVLPEVIKSASLTAEWENQLLEMERGEKEQKEFMDDIINLLDSILKACSKTPMYDLQKFTSHGREVIGDCPLCGKPVYENKNGYSCSDRGCPFVLWKEPNYLKSMKKDISKTAAKNLLKNGKTHMTGLYSAKNDKKFDAYLTMEIDENRRTKFGLEFEVSPKKATKSKKPTTKK